MFHRKNKYLPILNWQSKRTLLICFQIYIVLSYSEDNIMTSVTKNTFFIINSIGIPLLGTIIAF